MTTGPKSGHPMIGSFEEAELFHLKVGLALTPAQRLRNLEEMIRFNAEAEARNPGLRWIAEQLRDPHVSAATPVDKCGRRRINRWD